MLTFLDLQLAKLVENHIRSKGANVIVGNGVSEFLGRDGNLTGVKLCNGTELECDLAVVAIGVTPNTATFCGTIQTGICRIFDYTAGSTGLSEAAARAAFSGDVETVLNASPDKPGFMDGKLLVTRLVVEKSTGRILGAQCIGRGDVSKQIAIWAMAIQGRLRVDDMVNADLPYAPPFSLAIDHSIATAHIMQNKLRNLMKGISALEVKQRRDTGETFFVLDVRSPDEFEHMRLGIGEHLIPLGSLRNRLNELPADKSAEIICFCKISLRGYEAQRILEGHGWTQAKVMEGGIMAWPAPREK